jgi:7-cyano-7-deazaguanine reductase
MREPLRFEEYCVLDYIFTGRKKQLKSPGRRREEFEREGKPAGIFVARQRERPPLRSTGSWRTFIFTRREKTGNINSMKYGAKAIKQAKLELWPNPSPDRDYSIDITYPEFTCLCPRSGYPDFASIRINYTPDKKVVELKALKLYLNSFRDRSISHEAVTNLIFDTLSGNLKPRSLEVVGDFNVRGNVKTVIRVVL